MEWFVVIALICVAQKFDKAVFRMKDNIVSTVPWYWVGGNIDEPLCPSEVAGGVWDALVPGVPANTSDVLLWVGTLVLQQ
ncbi:hypothetical protein PG987_010272 [Apiospora arundinis]